MGKKKSLVDFFINPELMRVLMYDIRYDLDMSNINNDTILRDILGVNHDVAAVVTHLLESRNFDLKNSFVKVPNKVFEKGGYDSEKVAQRFVCFVNHYRQYQDLYNNSQLFLSNYKQCECFAMSVLKDSETDTAGNVHFQYNEEDMVFAV